MAQIRLKATCQGCAAVRDSQGDRPIPKSCSSPQSTEDPKLHGGSKPLLGNKGKSFHLLVGEVKGHLICWLIFKL